MIIQLCSVFLSLTLASSVYSETNSPASPPAYTAETELGDQNRVLASHGSNVTLPCRLHRQHGISFGSVGMRIKWTKLSADESLEEDILVSMGFHKKSYGSFQGRVHLLEANDDDASLVLSDVSLDDMGKFRCEVIDGIDDVIHEVTLEVLGSVGYSDGVVFPYSPRLGRYNLNFHDAEQACLDQDSVVASFDQLYKAWRSGMDWCNAGWLNDGSVQYPITKPRGPCGGANAGAGLRNYGQREKSKSHYDVFCFTSGLKGRFYWLVQPDKLTFAEAVQACQDDGAEIANVAQMYAAWKLNSYDRCDSGWLADGSVRYPISRPRRNCSPTEAAVRFVGFPDKKQKLFGVYCFKGQQ
ncbi:hyaluronan and proteoglycan link protein 1 isoform X1 [Coregonus clupeaformis]|uniref:hyaluronan and proteoglycan link protein 1 isoform X1 n=1 Tax=Coregonus clupeaformis TaxID=59861 RepID=UPI001BE064C0|nr:hyaluronan and proteoglycan link protein 1 isoform X1 [Coregonus clupeaformis]